MLVVLDCPFQAEAEAEAEDAFSKDLVAEIDPAGSVFRFAPASHPGPSPSTERERDVRERISALTALNASRGATVLPAGQRDEVQLTVCGMASIYLALRIALRAEKQARPALAAPSVGASPSAFPCHPLPFSLPFPSLAGGGVRVLVRGHLEDDDSRRAEPRGRGVPRPGRPGGPAAPGGDAGAAQPLQSLRGGRRWRWRWSGGMRSDRGDIHRVPQQPAAQVPGPAQVSTHAHAYIHQLTQPPMLASCVLMC